MCQDRAFNTYDFFTGLGTVDQIPEQNNFAVAGKTTSGDSSWRLLECHLLIVAVDGLLRVDMERSLGRAGCTASDRDLCLRILIERSKSGATLYTVVLDIFQLWEDARSPCDDSSDLDQTIQVDLTRWKIGNANS